MILMYALASAKEFSQDGYVLLRSRSFWA